MRFYGKLLAAIGLFVMAAGATPRQALRDLAFDARAAYVTQFGSPGDLDALIEQTRCTRVEQFIAAFGGYDAGGLYDVGGVYEHLLRDRLEAETRRLGRSLTDDDRVELRIQCAHDALGGPATPRDVPAEVLSSADPVPEPPLETVALEP